MSDNADWNDENTRLVCELFAEQVTAHNRSGTHLNKSGYKNVMEKFKDKTGLDYSRRQFKNKWDKMRREYANWKRLVKETGLGWDNEKKTYTAPDSRWKQLNKDYPGINKFKDGPLQFEELKTIMFEDIRNSGDDHWAPSSGAAPASQQDADPDEADDRDEDCDDNEASDDCDEYSPEPSRGKRPAPANRKDKGKKPKTSGGHWVQKELSKLVSLSARSTASCESLAKKDESSGCSIKDVMALVRECGAVPGTKEHFIASQVFVKRAEREMFLTLETPEERFQWLSMKHMWMTRNDSSM
ncbi:L10-interacting MYB domain-containing protein-like isoform X1 [Panicum hallii]|nr:L10-interacting MYB domain-containing protein-like isoform X1 [Panicum hallii]